VQHSTKQSSLIFPHAYSSPHVTLSLWIGFGRAASQRPWYNPRDMSALEHMAQGRVRWLEAKTHDNVSISASSHGEAAWFAATSHPPSQGNDRRSADAVANDGRWLQRVTLSLWLRSVYKCAIWQCGQVFPGLRAVNAWNTDWIRSAHAQGSRQGIKRIARPHHHVELDVHEHMHNAKLNKQSALGGCRMQWPCVDIVHSWWRLAYVSQRPSGRRPTRWAEVEKDRQKAAPPHPIKAQHQKNTLVK